MDSSTVDEGLRVSPATRASSGRIVRAYRSAVPCPRRSASPERNHSHLSRLFGLGWLPVVVLIIWYVVMLIAYVFNPPARELWVQGLVMVSLCLNVALMVPIVRLIRAANRSSAMAHSLTLPPPFDQVTRASSAVMIPPESSHTAGQSNYAYRR